MHNLLLTGLHLLPTAERVGFALYLEDCHPSMLLHCWLGHLTCKIVYEMTCLGSHCVAEPII